MQTVHELIEKLNASKSNVIAEDLRMQVIEALSTLQRERDTIAERVREECATVCDGLIQAWNEEYQAPVKLCAVQIRAMPLPAPPVQPSDTTTDAIQALLDK